MGKEKLVFILLRIGVAFVFLYAAVSSMLAPLNWIVFFPQILTRIFPATILISVFSVFEILLGLWILWGKGLFYSTALAAFTLAGIIIFNLDVLDLVFRDVAIMLTAAAISLHYYKR